MFERGVSQVQRDAAREEHDRVDRREQELEMRHPGRRPDLRMDTCEEDRGEERAEDRRLGRDEENEGALEPRIRVDRVPAEEFVAKELAPPLPCTEQGDRESDSDQG